ncbi:MAG: class I adenylate cyclase [Nitrospinales bacterium]
MITKQLNLQDELFLNRQSYLRFNQYKISKIIETMPETDRLVFIIIPRLLHVHQKGLPGYIAGDVPCGIYNFTVNREIQITSEKLFPNIIINRKEHLNPIIQTIFLMGSSGSIAQTSHSDLDYTLLIHKNSISKEDRSLFYRKLKSIEKWVWKNYQLEIHFFINEIEDFRRNIYGDSDSESTGSALAKLLKEEMYRTSVIVAGKIPLWWIVPKETSDKQYKEIHNRIQSHKTLLLRDEFIDMGNVDKISQEEFFGGSIWTLIKSFRSPFKTLMKMGLLEEYMFKDSKSNLLCHDIKNKVFKGVSYETIDPYINLFERVEAFFIENKTDNEVDALRTAFYLKVGTQVDGHEIQHGTTDPKKAILIKLIDSWGWSLEKVSQLNDYSNWQMMKKVHLGERMNKILINSYKNISEKGKSLESKNSLISQKDTHLLGRKLFSFYRKANNKIENLFALVDGATFEKELTFLHHQSNPKEKGTWYLIRGKTRLFLEQIDKEDIIKQAPNPLFLIAFAAFNNLYDIKTAILLRSEKPTIRERDLHNLLIQLSSFLANIDIANISNIELLAEARIKQLFLIIDFGYSLPRKIAMGNEEHEEINHEESDSISKNLEKIRSITSIYRTSWGELFSKTFSGAECIIRCVGELGKKADSFDKDPDALKTYILGSGSNNLELAWLKTYIQESLKTSKQPIT